MEMQDELEKQKPMDARRMWTSDRESGRMVWGMRKNRRQVCGKMKR